MRRRRRRVGGARGRGRGPGGRLVAMAADVAVQSTRVAPRMAGPGRRTRRAVATARRFYQSHRRAVRGLYSVVLALVAWEVVGRYVVTSKLMFAPFSRVIVEFGRLWMSGELEHHMLVSFSALAMGFAIAAAVGIAIGSLIAVSPAVGEHIDPLINALYATPLIALSPLLIMAFGLGPASKVSIRFLLCVFPILINTTSGIRSADDGLVEAARSFSASRGEIFRLVLLPSALPFIVAGLRIPIVPS